MLSAGAVLALFIVFTVGASRGVSSSSDYSVAGRRAASRAVAGTIMGALVGGGATVGTVQMAYQWGVSGIWFTLGSSVACLVLGLWFVGPLRSVELVTLPQFLGKEYGRTTAFLVALATSLGSFLSVVAQFLSGVALMRSVFPVSANVGALLVGALIVTFVFLGGIKSFSRLGVWKIAFLYVVMILCVVMVVAQGWTPWKVALALPGTPYFNPLARGPAKDLGSLGSLVLGVLCGQIYIQAVYTAANDHEARKGCMWASLLIPPMGLLGVWLGLFMRASGVVVRADQALPHFIRSTFHPLVGGVLWSGILITVLGTAVGLSLGVATNMTRDIVLPLRRDAATMTDGKILSMSRLAVVLVVLGAGLAARAAGGSMILQWAYLAMGIKASGIFVILLAAVTWPGRLPGRWGALSVLGGLVGVLLGALFLKGVDPLFPGVLLSAAVAAAGGVLGGPHRRSSLK